MDRKSDKNWQSYSRNSEKMAKNRWFFRVGALLLDHPSTYIPHDRMRKRCLLYVCRHMESSVSQLFHEVGHQHRFVRKFSHFWHYFDTGSPVRYLPFTNPSFRLHQRVPREKGPLSMHLDESSIKFISAVHAPLTIWHARHSAEMGWLVEHFTHDQWQKHLQPSFQRWIWVPPCIETWFITRHAKIHPHMQVLGGENDAFLTSRGKPPYQAVTTLTRSRPT